MTANSNALFSVPTNFVTSLSTKYIAWILGTMQWVQYDGTRVGSGSVTANGMSSLSKEDTLYYSGGGKIYAIDSNLSQLWSISESAFYLAVSENNTIYGNGSRAYDKNGSTIWTTTENGFRLSGPMALTQNIMYVSSQRAFTVFDQTPYGLYAVNIANGNIIWKKSLPALNFGHPIVGSDGSVYVMGDNFYCYQ